MARPSTFGFSRRIGLPVLVLAAAMGPLTMQVAAEAPFLQMGLPPDCVPGETCWIVNYIKHDPTTGPRDYTCGKAIYNAPPGNQGKGADITIRDLAAMRAGIVDRVAAPGLVAGVRDGWSTQYCHMRSGSIEVKKGMSVEEGDILGLLGLSGLTEYPHFHFRVAKGKTIIESFVRPNTGADVRGRRAPPVECGCPGPATLSSDDPLHRQICRQRAETGAGPRRCVS